MTVGIAAAYEDEDDPAVVLVADRMVTTGAVEYEHAGEKIETLSAGDPAVAAVASGTLSYADGIYYRAGERILEEAPSTVEGVADIAADVLHDIVREAANNEVLNNYGITLNQLVNEGVALSDAHVGNFLEAVTELKTEIQSNTNLLIVGVDEEHGAQIIELRNGDLTRHDSLGYHCIGSGEGSARLTFVRNNYDPDDVDDAVILAADAKNQAEEAQGVGRRMDIGIVDDRVRLLDDTQTGQIQTVIEDVRDAEQSARETTINEADIDSIR